MCTAYRLGSTIQCIIPPYMRRKLMDLYEDEPSPFEKQVEHFVKDENCPGILSPSDNNCKEMLLFISNPAG